MIASDISDKPQPTTNSAMQIIESLGPSPTMAQVVSASRELEKYLGNFSLVSISILRNITLEPGLPAALKVAGAAVGLRIDVSLSEFDHIETVVFDSNGPLYAKAPDLLVIALDLQSIAPALVLDFASLSTEGVAQLVDAAFERVLTIASAIRERSTATIVVHNFHQPLHPAYGILDAQMAQGQRQTITRLNIRLAQALSELSGAYVLDIDRLISEIGYERAIDQRYWHIARSPFTFQFQNRLAREYAVFSFALKGKTKKCIVLDCDNTLWGGIVGEDGVSGIALGSTSPGSAFIEMHLAVLNLYKRGVLLALASKNNERDVMEVLTTHPASALKPEHFVAKRINWEDKSGNIREIASELNIGLDSLVFVDDNPFECAMVRQILPEVTVIELPKDPSRYAGVIRSLPYFEKLTLSDEDRRRSEMYRASSSRESLRSSARSISDYLYSLSMKLTIARADSYSIPRISQLTQNTNQFNLTTRRYSEPEITQLAADPDWSVYYAEVVDRFDNAGIIAVAIVHDEAPVSRIDTFLMSCRVFGRGIEHALMSTVLRECGERGITSVLANYRPTAKNELASSFLSECGFKPRQSDDNSEFALELGKDPFKAAPEWFESIVVRGREVFS